MGILGFDINARLADDHCDPKFKVHCLGVSGNGISSSGPKMVCELV